MLDTAYEDDTLEELSAVVIMMARIQPADDNDDAEPKYDIEAISEVNALQINLISGMISKEADNQQRMNNDLKKKKALLRKELETCKEWVKRLENKLVQFSKYKEAYEELERKICVEKDTIERLLKEKDKIHGDFFHLENEKIITQHETALAKNSFKERENKHLDNIVDLEEKLSSLDRIVYKMGQSIQTIHIIGKKPNKVYDPFLKAGLGYQNPEHLKKAIAAQPKMMMVKDSNY
nr:hypothetical protein [Tanacetum cinerariifolium]